MTLLRRVIGNALRRARLARGKTLRDVAEARAELRGELRTDVVVELTSLPTGTSTPTRSVVSRAQSGVRLAA